MNIITIFRELQKQKLINKYIKIKIVDSIIPNSFKSLEGKVIETFTKNNKKIITCAGSGSILIYPSDKFEIKIYENKNEMDNLKKFMEKGEKI